MARYTLIVLSKPVQGREQEFDRWYTERHILDLLQVPGFQTAQRLRILEDYSQGGPQQFVAMYEIETEDLAATMQVGRERLGTEAMPMTEAFDMASAAFLVTEPITEKLSAAAPSASAAQ